MRYALILLAVLLVMLIVINIIAYFKRDKLIITQQEYDDLIDSE